MTRKIAGISIGAMFIIGLFVTMGFAFAQEPETAQTIKFIDAGNDGVCDNAGNCLYTEQAGGFEDADDDGICDNAGDCSMHNSIRGCHGSEGCPKMKEGSKEGCHRVATE